MRLQRRIIARLVANARDERLSIGIYASLVDQLFGRGATASCVMLAIAGIVLTTVAYRSDSNAVTASILTAMIATSLGRLWLLVAYKRWRHATLGTVRVTRIAGWEAVYAGLGIAMTLAIGAVAAYDTLADGTSFTFIVSSIVTIGVASGVAARNGSRPKIVFAQVTAIMLPFCVALLSTGTLQGLVVAGLFALYFASAYLSTRALYGSLRTALINERRNAVLKESIARTARMFDTAVNTMTNGLLMFDDATRLVIANERIKTMWGRGFVEALIGRAATPVAEAVFETMGTGRREAIALRRAFQAVARGGGEASLTLVDHVGRRAYALGLSAAEGGIVAIVEDVTEKRKQDAEIFRLAHQDALTGLANRLDLSRRMAAMIARGDAESPRIAMYVDLDGFKSVNDYFGHGVGDLLLVEVARRIADSTRPGDVIARIGGDEFVVCFGDVDGHDQAAAIARRLLGEIARPYLIDGKAIEIGASAGLAPITAATSPEEVLRLADVALYAAKTSGRGKAVWFEPQMDDRAREHREMTSELREAIESGALTLHYQPVTDFRTGRIVCCEALARWTSPKRGIVSPSVFIPLAEESDLIHKLGQWSIARACADAQAWPDPSVKVAVNLSAAQFKRPSISRTIAEILAATDLASARLEIEITESVLAEDLDAMTGEMQALNAQGVSIALDDFGMGYSSLGYLHALPIQKVKLDQSFVAKLDKDPSAIALVASIVQMASIMRKELVIEGVETAEQLALITQANARLIQGYYFSRPLPQEALIAFMTANVGPAMQERQYA